MKSKDIQKASRLLGANMLFTLLAGDIDVWVEKIEDVRWLYIQGVTDEYRIAKILNIAPVDVIVIHKAIKDNPDKAIDEMEPDKRAELIERLMSTEIIRRKSRMTKSLK
jgi:hypothetical protein